MYIGIDEVGRGALAGPIVACAVQIIDEQRFPFSSVRDSKKLSDTERRELIPHLRQSCAYAYGIASQRLIDRIGIQAANVLVFDIALRNFPKATIVRADHVGGFHRYTISMRNIEFYTNGESKFPEIAAASILAKVFRDDMMIRSAEEFPGYGFAHHKGYGTEAHRRAIHDRGLTRLHRKSFTLG